MATSLTEEQRAEVSESALARAETYVEQEEGAASRFRGWIGAGVTALAVIVSLGRRFRGVGGNSPPGLASLDVRVALVLCFIILPVARRLRHRLMPWDLALAAAAIAVIVYLLVGGD